MNRFLGCCFLFLGLAIATTGVASGQSLNSLLDDPVAAQDFDYCSWRFSLDSVAPDSLPDFLPDTEAILVNAEGLASEKQLAAASLVDAGVKISLASKTNEACQQAIANGARRFLRQRAREFGALQGRARVGLSKNPNFAEVQGRITDLWLRDQAARRTYIEMKTDDRHGARFWASRLAYSATTLQDEGSFETLRDLLDSYDWIDSHRFGGNVSSHAWTLVQHADDHPEFQALVLDRMAGYLENGGVKRSDYAHLWDRVAVNEGRNQRYGTQPDWECEGGKMQLMPIEDPEDVDQRRAEMGLGPVQPALQRMNRDVCR